MSCQQHYTDYYNKTPKTHIIRKGRQTLQYANKIIGKQNYLM
jgi:hypothetical protein